MGSPSFCFIEIPVADMNRAITFYNSLFEITLQEREIAGVSMAFFPTAKNDIDCALIKDDLHYCPSEKGVLAYLDGSPDLNTLLGRVETAGGRIILPKTKISDQHFYAIFGDTEGNRLALFSIS